MKVKEQRRYTTEERDFRGVKLRGQSFKGMNLSQANFSNADIRGTDFTDAILKDANFVGAKAGLQKRWVIVQLIILWLIAALAGLLIGYLGELCAFFFAKSYTDLYGYIPGITLALILFISLIVIAVQGLNRKAIETIVLAVDLVIAVTFVGAIVASGTVATTFAVLVFGAFAGSITVIFALVIAFIAAFAVAAAVTVTGSVTVAIIYITASAVAIFITFYVQHAVLFDTVTFVFSLYIAWLVLIEDPRFLWIRALSVQFSALGGTTFCGADLTRATFMDAMLKNTNFANSRHQPTILTHVCWENAQHLNHASVGSSILANPAVRKLLTTRNGYKKNYMKVDLSGADLSGANLNEANLKWVNLSQANLQKADLRGANLTETIAISTDFSGASLTGACLEALKIDKTAKLKDVDCQFVFLQEKPNVLGNRDRLPQNADQVFAPGEFETLIRQ